MSEELFKKELFNLMMQKRLVKDTDKITEINESIIKLEKEYKKWKVKEVKKNGEYKGR